MIRSTTLYFLTGTICFHAIQAQVYHYLTNNGSYGPQSDSLWFTPPSHNGTYYFNGVSPTQSQLNNAQDSKWYIAEWSIPDAIPLTAIFPSNTTIKSTPCVLSNPFWYVENANGRVCLQLANHNASKSANTYTKHNRFFAHAIEQNTHMHSNIIELHLNGSNNLQCGNEYDLFLSPIDDNYAKNGKYPLGFNTTNSPFLSQMTALFLNFHVTYNASQTQIVQHRCAETTCGNNSVEIDYGYGVLGLVFSNLLNKQTLFYQILLFDTRDNLINCQTGGNTCSNMRNWFFQSNPFGVSDSVQFFNDFQCLTNIKNHSLNFDNVDILSRIKYNLNGSDPEMPNTIDTNLSNWRVGSMYIGGGIQGFTSVTMLVNDINIWAQT